ncbi:MAG: hypothetical protein ACKOYC_08380 [Bacteroidota bacterium]
MRIKFRRILIPAFILLLSVVSGVWFYASYTDLDLFTVKNLESQAGPCSMVDLQPQDDFQSKILSFLADDSDSNLVAAFQSNNDLLKSFKADLGCYAADQIRNISLESKKCLTSIINNRLFHLQMKKLENSRRGLFLPKDESADSSFLILQAVLLQEHSETSSQPIVDSLSIDASSSFLKVNPTTQSPDSLKSHLVDLISKLNGTYHAFMADRELESNRLAEARLEHGLRMGEARTRLFLFALIAWMVSLVLISSFYVASVFKRSQTVIESGLLPATKGFQSGESIQPPSHKTRIGDELLVEAVGASADVDLSKVFFKCGGDIQLMKQMLNRYLTSSFAIAHNLKSYSKNGSIDAAERLLKTLHESSVEMGFESIAIQSQKVLELMDDKVGIDEVAVRIAKLSEETFSHISKVKAQMGRHPAFN